MKTSLFPLVALLTALAVGCHRSQTESREHGDEHAAGEHAEPGVTFKEGKGLHVPPATAKFIGLRAEDLSERMVTASVRFTAEIYRTATEAQFASLDAATSTTAFASAQVNQSDAASFGKGQEVAVETTDQKAFRGRIAEINPTSGTNSGQCEIIVAVADDKAQLRHGALVSVVAQIGDGKTVAAVPASALLRTAEGTFVYTVSGERFVRTPVKLGVVNHEFAEITDGLYAGDQIVVQPVMTLWMAELQSIRGGKACADGH